MTESLKNIKLFSDLPDELLQWIRVETSWREFKKGEYLFSEGEPARRMFVIAEGRVKVVKEFASGKNAIMGMFGPGSVVAEAAVIDGLGYPASAIAMEKTIAGAIPAPVMLEAIKKAPELSLKIIEGLGSKLRELTANMGSISTQKVEKRLARFLYKLSQEIGELCEDGTLLTLPMTRRDLAEIIGTSFEVVERALKKMRENEIIAVESKKILIREHAMELAAVLAFLNAILALPILFFIDLAAISIEAYVIIFGAGLLGSFGYLFASKSIRHMELSEASPLFLLSPGLTAFLAFVLLGEGLTQNQLTGIVLLMIGAYVLEIKKGKDLMEPVREVYRSRFIHFAFLQACHTTISFAIAPYFSW